MNIGFFYIPYYPVTSGRSIHGYQLVKGLAGKGHRILSCLGDGNPDCIHFKRSKAGAIKLAREADVLYIRVAGTPVFSYLEQATLLKLIRPRSLGVVWEVNAPVEELKASFPPGPFLDKLMRRENRKRKALARLVDGAVGVSDVLRDYIQNVLHIPKAYCIPNGSDPEHFLPKEPRQTPLSHLRDTFKVCWMGNSKTPWQGLDLIIETAQRMESDYPDIVFVIITGESLWRFPVLRNLLVLRKVPYDDCPHYLAAADACLCIYNDYDWIEYGFYGSSLKLFDYMASGKPVIASPLGQIAHIIRHGENGLLSASTSDSLMERILQLKSDPHNAARLGRNARNDVMQYYNWERAVSQTEQVLRDARKKQ